MEQEQVDILLNESTGKRITKQYIERRISDTLFTSLVEGSTTTICQITIDNGFTVRGENNCVDPINHNKELGKHYAYEDAFNKLWPLFGFLLTEKMYRHNLIEQIVDDEAEEAGFIESLDDEERNDVPLTLADVEAGTNVDGEIVADSPVDDLD